MPVSKSTYHDAPDITNRASSYYFANNKARRFVFNTEKLVNSARLSAGKVELGLLA